MQGYVYRSKVCKCPMTNFDKKYARAFAFGSKEHTEISKYLENAFKERYKERPTYSYWNWK